jgi:hypothetical protein
LLELLVKETAMAFDEIRIRCLALDFYE